MGDRSVDLEQGPHFSQPAPPSVKWGCWPLPWWMWWVTCGLAPLCLQNRVCCEEQQQVGYIQHRGPRPHVCWLLCMPVPILQMVQKKGEAFVCGPRDVDV